MKTAWKLWVERGVIVAGVLSFWPWILGHRSLLYELTLVGVVVALGAVAVVRVKRVKRSLEETCPPGGERPIFSRRRNS